jgi:phenylacetate-CoA ligase
MRQKESRQDKDAASSPDYTSRKEILNIQESRFTQVVSHILKVPFYQKKLAKAGANIKEICGISDLTKLPFTTKDELRATSPMERTSLDLGGIAFFFSSSGTTGSPSVYPWSTNDELVLRTVAARCMKRVGIGPGDISLVVAPFGMPIMWYCMINQYLAASAGVVPLGVEPPDIVIKAINAFPVTVVTTVPVIATRSIEFLKANKIQLTENKVRHFHFGGDYLSGARRRRIEDYFDVQCYDFYGLSEIFGPIAGECEEKNGLHLAADYVLVEVIDPCTKQPVQEGETGVAVYTTLWEKGAPLLRFWSDDYVSVTAERCRCGRTSPRIHYVGRPNVGAAIGNRRIFAKDIEDLVLSFPQVGDEWNMRIEGTMETPKARLCLENLGQEIPIKEIEEQLAGFLGIPVKLDTVAALSLPRENVKPQPIVDMRPPRVPGQEKP